MSLGGLSAGRKPLLLFDLSQTASGQSRANRTAMFSRPACTSNSTPRQNPLPSSEPIAAAALAPLKSRTLQRPFRSVVAHGQKLNIHLHFVAHFGRDNRWERGFNT